MEKEQESIQEQIVPIKKKCRPFFVRLAIPVDEQNVDIAVNQLNAALKKAQLDKEQLRDLHRQLETFRLRIERSNR